MYQLFEYLVSYNALKHNLGLGDCGDVAIVDEKNRKAVRVGGQKGKTHKKIKK